MFPECVQVCTVYPYLYLCCAHLGNSFEVKVEAASNDITECSHDDKPSIGTLCFYDSTIIRQCKMQGDTFLLHTVM